MQLRRMRPNLVDKKYLAYGEVERQYMVEDLFRVRCVAPWCSLDDDSRLPKREAASVRKPGMAPRGSSRRPRW